jgi:L-ascorbate metabolism protein UlaG (beta-lactamase superfamily)
MPRSSIGVGGCKVGDRLTFLGHSTVLVDLDGVRVLTGPLLGHLDLASLRALPGHPALIVPASLGRVVAKVAHGVIHEMRVGGRRPCIAS